MKPVLTRHLLLEGVTFSLNKPEGWTSFDAVKFVRKFTGSKVGHAGTLDPLATGVLVLCTGSHTKKIQTIQAGEKEYTGLICLGHTTPSLDLETPISESRLPVTCDTENIAQAASAMVGSQAQIPPAYSAKQIKGKRAYEFARKGEEVKLEASQIRIDAFDILACTQLEDGCLHVSFRLVCSKGTYVRCIARDLGKALGYPAYLHKLIRTRSGDFSIDHAYTTEELRTCFPKSEK
ncbi:MAG: tRNA pseudouridine(55) synthase TruB [Bacteroidota bacterium]